MRRGFTLVEVLVALAVVALGVSALFSVLAQSSRSAEQLRVRTLANWAAADALTALRLGNQLPPGGTRRREEISGRLWWVEYQVQQSTTGRLRDVEVRIRRERSSPSLASARGMVRLDAPAAENGGEQDQEEDES